MPIGTSAIYIPLNLSPPLIGYSTDEAYLCFTPTAPLRRLYDRGYWWPWTSGSSVPGVDTGVTIRVPDDWIVPPPPQD